MSIVQDATLSGSPRAVASASCAEAPDRPGHAPRPTNRRLRIPFQYPQCQRARRSAGGSFKPTAYLKNAERERPAGPCGPAENAGYMWLCGRVSNAFAGFFAVFYDPGADAAPAGPACRRSPRRLRAGRSGARLFRVSIRISRRGHRRRRSGIPTRQGRAAARAFRFVA